LLIVSNVARAHGGEVRAAVSEWNGARFTLELPRME
jgi:C4-dicarboxylate-specific signal transduction histidine kinase